MYVVVGKKSAHSTYNIYLHLIEKKMCLFPQGSIQRRIGKYSYNIECECGACPECMQKKSRVWALRCAMQSLVSVGFMCTLTYDDFERDENGRIIGEKKKDYSNMCVSKRDCQLFIKRFRKHFAGSKKSNIKYLLTAEYGDRTGRPHYHALFFGVMLSDLIPYKKSKRGNQIYMSNTLTKIWNNGICTVDCINLNTAVASYCTKYCSKNNGRSSDTFMLFSRDIGTQKLLEKFNGKSYIVDGREYPIPRTIWHKIIAERYGVNFRYVNKPADRGEFFMPKYVFPSPTYMALGVVRHHVSLRMSYRDPIISDSEYLYRQAREDRRFALYKKHTDPQYRAYVEYWRKKSELQERPDRLSRILALPNDRFFGYKQYALKCLNNERRGVYDIPPRSNSVSYSARKNEERYRRSRLCCAFVPSAPLVSVAFQTPFAVPPLVYIRQMTLKNLSFGEKVETRKKNIRKMPFKCLTDSPYVWYSSITGTQIDIFER